MNKEPIIRILELEPIDLEQKEMQPHYRLKEYLQYEARKIPTGNYYTIEEIVRLLRGNTSKNVNTNINNSKVYLGQNENRIFQYAFNKKYNFDNLRPMVSQEETIINVKSEELQKRIQELAIIIPNEIKATTTEVTSFEETLYQVALRVHNRESMKLQRDKNFVKAIGVLAAIATASLIGAKAVGYISEQQQEQRAKYYKDLEEYNPRDHSPEHGPLYSAQEILERYELEQQYLEEQQNDFEEGKTR